MAFVEANLKPLLGMWGIIFLYLSDPCILFLNYNEIGGEGIRVHVIIFLKLQEDPPLSTHQFL